MSATPANSVVSEPAPVRNSFMKRVVNLIAREGFRSDPIGGIWRCGLWALCVATRMSPRFRLTAAGSEWMRVPSDLRYTSVCGFVLRDRSEPELHQLHQFIRPGDTLIDAGANIGLYTLKGARIVGASGRVISVEPGHVAADQLTANVALNQGRNDFAPVTIIREALSDHVGSAVLHHVSVGDDPQAFSLLADNTSTAGETVNLTTLDALVDRLGIIRIDCLKMDVEGAEPMLIDGGRNSLQRFRPIVLFEVNSSILDRRGDRSDGAWQKLEAMGYGFFRLVRGKLSRLHQMPDDWCNVVAVHPEGPQPH